MRVSGNTFNDLRPRRPYQRRRDRAANDLEKLIIEAANKPTLTVLYDDKLRESSCSKRPSATRLVLVIQRGERDHHAINLQILNQYGPEGMTVEEARASADAWKRRVFWLPLGLDSGADSSNYSVVRISFRSKRSSNWYCSTASTRGQDSQSIPHTGEKLESYEEIVEVFQDSFRKTVES